MFSFWRTVKRNWTKSMERRIFLVIALLGIFFIILLIRASSKQQRKQHAGKKHAAYPPCIVLWWNSQLKAEEWKDVDKFYCHYRKCRLTGDRRYLAHATVILFYGSDIVWHDLPLPRNPKQIWALLHEESPRNKPEFMSEALLKHFNYTSTFSRHSDFPIMTSLFDNSILELTDQRLVTQVARKTELRDQFAPVLFIQSDCLTMTARTDYVEELMKYIPIDSYGKCLNNRQLPESLQEDYLNHLYADKMLRFIGQYKFMISIENGVCNDYITEKYWRPLIAGVIPIYFGSPTIKDWQPHNHSTIYISDFKNPKDLANFLLELDKDDRAYIKYLHHKYNQLAPITNSRLIEEMHAAEGKNADEGKNLFINFGCQVLKALWSTTSSSSKPSASALPLSPSSLPKMANRWHYNCPQSIPHPPMENEPKELHFWHEVIGRSSCLAQAVDELLQKNQPFTEKQLNDTLAYRIANKLC